jgi:hypothetical protein
MCRWDLQNGQFKAWPLQRLPEDGGVKQPLRKKRPLELSILLRDDLPVGSLTWNFLESPWELGGGESYFLFSLCHLDCD